MQQAKANLKIQNKRQIELSNKAWAWAGLPSVYCLISDTLLFITEQKLTLKIMTRLTVEKMQTKMFVVLHEYPA